MPARSQLKQLVTKFGMLFGALFVVTVLLAAMPGHHTPTVQSQESQGQPPVAQPQRQSQAMDPNMPRMNMDDAKASDPNAVHDMTATEHEHNAHMHMTEPRPQTPERRHLSSTHESLHAASEPAAQRRLD